MSYIFVFVMGLSETSNKKQTCVDMFKCDKVYLKSKGIKFSHFMEQAVMAHRQGKFEYKYEEE